MRTKQQAAPIKNILEAVIFKISGEKKDISQKIQQAWEETVGREVYKHARPSGFRANKLIVNADSSAWFYEINLRKKHIGKKINKNLKKDNITISEMVVRLGKF